MLAAFLQRTTPKHMQVPRWYWHWQQKRVLHYCDTRQYAIASELYSTDYFPHVTCIRFYSTSLVLAKQESTDVPFTRLLALRLQAEQGPQFCMP